MDVTTSAGAGNNINTGGRGTCTAAAASASANNAFPRKKMTDGPTEGKKRIEYRRSPSQQGKKVVSGGGSGYFSFRGLFLLGCLTASLLLLPLILPPLPPPPFLLLLLLPICALGLLMVLAFMPSNVRDAAANTYL